MRPWARPVLATPVLATVVGLCIACGSGEEKADVTQPETVVAEMNGGEVTAADVDRHVLGLPAAQRPDPQGDPVEQYGTIARRIAADRLLLAEAALVGADQDPRFRLVERRVERQVLSDQYLRQQLALDPVTEEEVRQYYDDNLEEYQRDEKRRLSHIYQRFGPDKDRDQVVTTLNELRERLLVGEDFARLAREHSESETRHRGGEIGEIGRGHFTPDFDRVVFALEERLPSTPVVTPDGAHLFMVWEIWEERRFAFDEVRRSIYEQLQAERLISSRREIAAALPVPDNPFVPSRQEITQLLRLGDPATVILRLGDFAITTAQFREILQEQRRLLGAKYTPDLPFQLLEEIHDREIIYQHLQSAGTAEDAGPDDANEQVQRERDRELALFFARRQMTLFVERRADVLQRHYDNNKMRFASPLRLHLRRLTLPFGADGTQSMAVLEAARSSLDAGQQTLEELAEKYSGEVVDLGFLSAAQFQAMAPRAVGLVFLLKEGEHSPPMTRGEVLVMFQALAREDPQPRALALVRDQVVEDYLTHYSADVFAEMTNAMLEEAEFRLFPDRLAKIKPGVKPTPG